MVSYYLCEEKSIDDIIYLLEPSLGFIAMTHTSSFELYCTDSELSGSFGTYSLQQSFKISTSVIYILQVREIET